MCSNSRVLHVNQDHICVRCGTSNSILQCHLVRDHRNLRVSF
ncbi:unnamed protein product [Brassica rapa]|uniref:Uncharacterized protein n=1 Tax=Brassica campestris TaxID=3711 RepID=A0A3P6A7D6_BRACM|nr:unnamed protein product [Brassica rapa]VDC83133.1 unnamed protein product [Brassica rapa]